MRPSIMVPMLSILMTIQSTNTLAADIYIDPTAPLGGNGTFAQPYNSWDVISFSLNGFIAGNNYYQKAGTTFTGTISVKAQANADVPITIAPYGNGTSPKVNGTFNFEGAHNIILSGYSVSGTQYPSVVIQKGASYITIKNNELSNSTSSGVEITNSAGGNNSVYQNHISNNVYFGVNVFEVTNTIGSETHIYGNVIAQNGSHGIEIKGNYFHVYGNKLISNGQLSGGASGIHTYTGGHNSDPFSFPEFGSYNTIKYNIVQSTKEPEFTDGHGILLDQKTHHNEVSKNICFNNDGAGIHLYDAHSNIIFSNITFNNSQNSATGIGQNGIVFAELLLTASPNINSNYNNTITGNTLIGVGSERGSASNPNPRGLAFFADEFSAAKTSVTDANVLINLSKSLVWSYNGQTGNSTDGFNQIKWQSGLDNVNSTNWNSFYLSTQYQVLLNLYNQLDAYQWR